MATKRKTETKTATLNGAELVEWLRTRIGEQSVEAFAKSIGMTRQAVSGVLAGRREPGVQMLKALKPLGLQGSHAMYVVAAK